MERPPIRKPYFSPVQRKEKTYLALCWAVAAACVVILVLFWEQTSTMALYDYFASLRAVSPLKYFFIFFTFLGDEEFFILFFGILIWCVSKPFGFWSAMVLVVSLQVYSPIKHYTALPRPVMEGQLADFAFPSGHTQSAVAIWGYMAVHLKKRGFWIWAFACMLLIPFSRIVLGYHFLGDILGGYATGITLLLFLLWAGNVFVEKGWAEKFTKPLLLALCVVIPVVLTAVAPYADMSRNAGVFVGATVGYILENEKIRFSTKAPWYCQLLKAVIGSAVLFGIIMGLKGILSSDNEALQVWLRFIRYGLGGIWVTLVAPALFVALKLTSREPA